MPIEEAISALEREMPEGATFEERLRVLGGRETTEREDVIDHELGVARHAVALAREVGFGDEACAELRKAARWHDIGKLAIPDAVLRKPGRHTEEEFETMRLHARAGARLLGEDSPQAMRDVAAYHHERYDGHGYEGMKGEEIPLFARIVQVADVHDALIQKRDYKNGMAESDALSIMTADVDSPGFGRRAFDPFLLRRFVAMRLADPEFSAPAGDRALLEAFAASEPMDDLSGGPEANGGWTVKRTGHRIRYETAPSGNLRMAEMRSPLGEVQAVRGQRHAPGEPAAPDEAPSFSR